MALNQSQLIGGLNTAEISQLYTHSSMMGFTIIKNIDGSVEYTQNWYDNQSIVGRNYYSFTINLGATARF